MRHQQRDENLREQPVALANEGVENVAAIQLPDGKQIQRRRRRRPPKPRAPPDAGRCRSPGRPGKTNASNSRRMPGVPKIRSPCVAMPGMTFENASPIASAGTTNDESGQRTRDPDIEQLPLGVDRRADADERAQRADQRRSGQEIRQGGIDRHSNGTSGSGPSREPAGWSAA